MDQALRRREGYDNVSAIPDGAREMSGPGNGRERTLRRSSDGADAQTGRESKDPGAGSSTRPALLNGGGLFISLCEDTS